jgi:DNA-binding IclR family transcriptional regulator
MDNANYDFRSVLELRKMSKPRASVGRRVGAAKSLKNQASAKRGKHAQTRYNAPALEKGLAIMEIVSAAPHPIKTEEIARAAGRSRNEIYRMLQVLQTQGYIVQEKSGEGYVATNQLFTLGMRKVPIGNLNTAALPEMRKLSDELGQSVWLVVPADDEIVFIAGVESRHSFGLSVNLGYHRPIVLANSGRLLYAFQPPERQLTWLAQLREAAPPGADFESFIADADKARRDGWLIRPSVAVEGVTDVCAPIWTATGVGCSANLIVPLIRVRGQHLRPEEVARLTRATADRITQSLRPHIGPE